MMKYILFFSLCSLALFFSYAIRSPKPMAAPNVEAPVVVELFTSQSCSSCPPADRILASLAQNPNIIALSCHVSYWNHLHWKDTLSHEFCDMRQHGYAGKKGSRRVYTPQMIVNGTNEFVGSHNSKVKFALNNAQRNPIQAIKIEMPNPYSIEFTLPEADKDSYRLWAFGYQNTHHEDIPSGENRGRSVTYANPVQSYTNLGAWDGKAAKHEFTTPDAKIDGIAILAQRGGYGEIIAAGKLVFSHE